MLGGMNDFTAQPSGSIVQFRGFSISPGHYFSAIGAPLQREGPSALVAENFMSWIDDINTHHKLNLSPNHQVNTWDGVPKTISPAVPTGVYDPEFGDYYYGPFDGSGLYDRYTSGNLYHSIMDGYNANDEELWYDWCKKLSQLYQAVGVHDYFDEIESDLYVHEGSKTFVSGSGGQYLSVNTNGLRFDYTEPGQSGRVAGPKDFILSKTVFPSNFSDPNNVNLITDIKIISPSSLSVAGEGVSNKYSDGKIPGWYPITGSNTESFYYDILTNHQGHISKSIGQPFPSPSITVRGFAGAMGIIEANTACNFKITASSLYSCARLDTLWVDRPYEFVYYNRASEQLNNFENLIFSGVKADNGLSVPGFFISVYSPFTGNNQGGLSENIFHGRSLASRLDLDVTDIGRNGIFVTSTGGAQLVAAGVGNVPDKYWDNLKIASDLVENICGERITYYPVVRDGEACVNLAGELNVSLSEVHRGVVFYALVGSGTMYNRYGIPTINGFEKACTDLYHSLPVNFPLVIEYGKFDGNKYYDPEDPYDNSLDSNRAIRDEIVARRTELLFDQFVPSGRVDFNIKPFFDYPAGYSSDSDPDGHKKYYVFLLFRHKDSHFNFDDAYYSGVQSEILDWYNGLPVDITDEQSMIDLGKYDINSELWYRYYNDGPPEFKQLRQSRTNIGGYSIQNPQPVDIVPDFADGFPGLVITNFINKYVGGYWNCQDPLESLAGCGTADWSYLSRGSSGAFLRPPEQPVKYSLYDDHFDYVMLNNTQQSASESYVYVPLKRPFDRTGNNPQGSPPYPFLSEYYEPTNTDGIIKVVPE